MAYTIRKSNNKYIVVDDRDREYGDHDTMLAARRQQRSLTAGESTKEHGFVVFKQGGSYRWVAVSSTSFQDRDLEIVSQKALAADVARTDERGVYGPLRWWHMPIDIGDCDFRMVHGKSLIESGTFKSAAIARAVQRNAHNLALSIGFLHPVNQPDASGVFDTIYTYERSLLPQGKESNRFTRLTLAVKEESLSMSAEKMAAFEQLIGADAAKAFLSASGQAEKAAESLGIASKEMQDKPDGKVALAVKALQDALKEVTETQPAEPALFSAQEVQDLSAAIVAQLVPQLSAATSKASNEALALANKAMTETLKNAEALSTAVQQFGNRLKALEGDQPNGQGYRATQDAANVTTQKAAQPAVSTIDAFLQNLGL